MALKISLYFIFHDFFMKRVLELSSSLNIYVVDHQAVRTLTDLSVLSALRCVTWV